MDHPGPMETYIRDRASSYFHFDYSRLAFIRDTESTLRNLVGGRLAHRTHYRRLLLGRKGTGKSTLLKVINLAACDTYRERLVVCSTHYINMHLAELPSTLIAKAVETPGNPIQLPVRIDKLDEYLKSVNKFVLFIADELDSVFLSTCGAVNSQQIIGEIAEIGNSSEGRIHCIISGSSHQLRQLCFGKLPDKDKKDFPNYVGINLNSTKFSARWIHPFLGKDDFDKVFRLLQNDANNPLDTCTKIMIYVLTGGNGRHMSKMVQDPITMAVDSYSLSLKEISSEELTLLQTIFTCVIDFMPAHEPVDEFHWTQYVPLSSVEHHYLNLPLISLYSLADRGLVRFNDHFNALGFGPEVSLGTPLVYLQLNHIGRDYLTTSEAIALRCPHGDYLAPIAKQVAMKFLVEKAAKWIVPEGQAVKLKPKEFQLNLLSIMDGNKEDMKELSKISIDDLVDCFWNVLHHSYAVFHQADDEGRLIAHYIQLELGASQMLRPEAEKLVEKCLEDMKAISGRYAACQKPLLQQKLYLVTTRQLAPDVKETLQHGFIPIIDAAKLKRDIWPDSVKNLGKPYK